MVTTFADKPTIAGTNVMLRPVAATDAENIWTDLHDADAIRFTGTHATLVRDQIAAHCANRGDQVDRLDLVAEDARTGDWLGEVVINEWDPDNRSCGFRIALSAGARDRG
jgi:RimJ/RimL family protein N-acetyltransferase